jgi:hypothetical protein
MVDRNALDLHRIGNLHLFGYPGQYRRIFKDFLDSAHPLALDGERCANAACAGLKTIFEHHKALVSCFTWFSQHLRTLRVDMEHRPKRHHTDLPAGTDWSRRVQLYWQLRAHLSTWAAQGMPKTHPFSDFGYKKAHQRIHSSHLQSLLEKAAYSDRLLNLARRRVFRFGYLHRKHPIDIKQAIFALAKYIQRVTGKTGEVRACESIWGGDKWFAAAN